MSALTPDDAEFADLDWEFPDEDWVTTEAWACSLENPEACEACD